MWLLVLPLWFIAFSLIGISGSLRRLTDHNLKFSPPEPEPDAPASAPL